MNLGKKDLELKFEKGVGLLCQYMPVGEDRKKPLLMHALRTGMYLYDNNYSEEIVLAGLLHDIVEWTEASEGLVATNFGQNVNQIVVANTQNRQIESKKDQWADMVARCVKLGKDAIIVKAADTLDSLKFYRSIANQDEIQRSIDIAQMILEMMPKDMHDPIFDLLGKEI